MSRDLVAGPGGLRPEILDHAREFVEEVLRAAPAEYRRLLGQPRFRELLAGDPAFNHGKLYAWAEYTVFRREFHARFPAASDSACINAFSRLLLKNDISITNLVEYCEGAKPDAAVLLERGTDRE